MEDLKLPGLPYRIGRRWLGAVPCAVFCIVSGGMHGNYELFEEKVATFDPSLDAPFKAAHSWRMLSMNFALVFCAILLYKAPQHTRLMGMLGFFLEAGHGVVAYGVHSSIPLLLYIGSLMIGLGVGSLYGVGVKLLLSWIDESQWIPAGIAVVSYAIGVILGDKLFPLMLYYLHVVPVMYTLGLCLLLVGVTVSDDCRLPSSYGIHGPVSKDGHAHSPRTVGDVETVDGQGGVRAAATSTNGSGYFIRARQPSTYMRGQAQEYIKGDSGHNYGNKGQDGGNQYGGNQYGGSQYGGSQYGGNQYGGNQYGDSQTGSSQYGQYGDRDAQYSQLTQQQTYAQMQQYTQMSQQYGDNQMAMRQHQYSQHEHEHEHEHQHQHEHEHQQQQQHEQQQQQQQQQEQLRRMQIYSGAQAYGHQPQTEYAPQQIPDDYYKQPYYTFGSREKLSKTPEQADQQKNARGVRPPLPPQDRHDYPQNYYR